mmetsp:Transcript_8499/g.24606  ORF Transcript_8499/g.24606 Transcript_8499/m.24606 type:complete len:256 (-) Transcript_8499:588-1355(-)
MHTSRVSSGTPGPYPPKPKPSAQAQQPHPQAQPERPHGPGGPRESHGSVREQHRPGLRHRAAGRRPHREALRHPPALPRRRRRRPHQCLARGEAAGGQEEGRGEGGEGRRRRGGRRGGEERHAGAREGAAREGPAARRAARWALCHDVLRRPLREHLLAVRHGRASGRQRSAWPHPRRHGPRRHRCERLRGAEVRRDARGGARARCGDGRVRGRQPRLGLQLDAGALVHHACAAGAVVDVFNDGDEEPHQQELRR